MRRIALSSIFLLFYGQHIESQAAWLVKKIENETQSRILAVSYVNKVLSEQSVELRSIPAQLSEFNATSERYVETLYADSALPNELMNFKTQSIDENLFSKNQSVEKLWPGSEVRTLVYQGPKENRINLPIVGDGYTTAEKEKFFQDAARITNELFTHETFASYLPLFNVYAVFVPSKESGLTDGANKKDTALKLYRTPARSKRAIMFKYSDRATIDRAIALAPASDYPILLANDDFYGGLGGEYAITTRSVKSGIIVLRHELGHNFGNVGEEYDGGEVYEGANFSATKNVPWKHWINGETKIYETRFLNGEYLWKDFSAGPLKVNFQFPQALPQGEFIFDITISAIGWKTPNDISAYLDGEFVEMNGLWSDDRSFFKLKLTHTPSPGQHTLEFRENIVDPNHVFAFAQIFAHPPEIDTTLNNVAAFSTFNNYKTQVGYRPTFSTCLMKDMERQTFCAVDEENMWNRFLDRIDLIDAVDVVQNQNSKTVTLKTPALSGLSIRWYQIGTDGKFVDIPELTDKKIWEITNEVNALKYKVEVRFKTPEVRKSTGRYVMQKEFSL